MKTNRSIPELVIRLLMGTVFVLFGASKFYPFMPTPPVPAEASSFIVALIVTGYLWQFVGAVEVVGGALLILGRNVPMAVALLAPIIANIVPYLLILAKTGSGAVMAVFLVSAEVFLVWRYRHAFVQLVRA